MADSDAEAIRTLWEVGFNQRDPDAIRAAIAPDYVNHAALPGTPPGPDGQVQVMERLWSAFPDAHFAIEHLARDGDTIVCVGTMSGTHEGELFGVAGTGKPIRWRQCHLIRTDAQGKAVEHRAVRDDLGLLQQMGVAPQQP